MAARRRWAPDSTAPPSGAANATRTAIARSGGEGGGSGDCNDGSGPLGPPPCRSGDRLEQEAGGGSPPPSPARIQSWAARWWHVRAPAAGADPLSATTGATDPPAVEMGEADPPAMAAAVIAAGARTVVVAGMIPIGCEPEMLALFPGGAGNYYDPASGCITRFNDLAELHNRELQRALHELRRAHPGATAVRYADLYGPVAAAVASPKEYGFGSSPLAACCGSGGEPYNFNANFTGFCATPGSTVCADGPSSSVSWDGIHYTEATNKLVARAILTRP
ncbi:Os10g0393700 [Oryza sativa Japonica Group]|uniref:Os10g0393700 protein n=1 Tax=Oryza sativa subsp. japonica TaxID=39947 RepID=A0A0P0XTS4_ORYSJ|nr:Os10g0393700 [Oryza sativa Japonica Group]